MKLKTYGYPEKVLSDNVKESKDLRKKVLLTYISIELKEHLLPLNPLWNSTTPQ